MDLCEFVLHFVLSHRIILLLFVLFGLACWGFPKRLMYDGSLLPLAIVFFFSCNKPGRSLFSSRGIGVRNGGSVDPPWILL